MYTNNMKDVNPRSEAMLAPPVDSPILEYMEPDAEPELLTIDNSADILENELVVALLNILRSGKDTDKLKAATEVKDILGRGQKGQVVIGKNVQINQIEAQPELKRHLIESAHGLRSLIEAKDARIKSKFGGEGV